MCYSTHWAITNSIVLRSKKKEDVDVNPVEINLVLCSHAGGPANIDGDYGLIADICI